MIESILAPAFTAWGSPVTWLELLAFALSIAMVIGNQRQWIVAWPLAIGSSLLYGLLFWHGQLFGEAWLQLRQPPGASGEGRHGPDAGPLGCDVGRAAHRRRNSARPGGPCGAERDSASRTVRHGV